MGSEGIKETAVDGNMGYGYGMTVTYTDLLGNKVDYTMYYDKIFLSSHAEEGETEENYSINGILITDTGTYPVEGKYETEAENEGGESESEAGLYFKAFTDETKTSFIEVEQESESESEGGESESEIKYSYSVYVNSVMTEKTVVEYENEDGELEVKLSICDNGGAKTTLVFKDESKQNQRILRASGTVEGKTSVSAFMCRKGNIVTNSMTVPLPTRADIRNITATTMTTMMTMTTIDRALKGVDRVLLFPLLTCGKKLSVTQNKTAKSRLFVFK